MSVRCALRSNCSALMCLVRGCLVYTPRRFSRILFKKPKSPPFLMMAARSSNSFAIVKFATAKMKMKTLPAGFPVALCSTAIQFSDRHSHRSFLLLRIVDRVVDAVDVVDVSVSEIVAFPPCKRLAFQGMVLMQRQILVDVEEALDAHQNSNEESNVRRSAAVQLSQLYSRVFRERSKNMTSSSPILCSARDFR